jgi:hypothetical protein
MVTSNNSPELAGPRAVSLKSVNDAPPSVMATGNNRQERARSGAGLLETRQKGIVL